jgi:hypothetical protein
VCDNARGLPFAWQAVTGGPHEVAEQYVRVQVFFECLAFQKGITKCVAQRTDCIGEHMVEHGFTLQVCENRGCANGDL